MNQLGDECRFVPSGAAAGPGATLESHQHGVILGCPLTAKRKNQLR